MAEQLQLPGAEQLGTRASSRKTLKPADIDPYAVVAVLRPVPGHSGEFDYVVPSRLDAAVVPGARVRVRFRGVMTDGLVLRRQPTTSVTGRMQPISSVSGSVVIPLWAVQAWQDIAAASAGSLAEVARWGVPERHAATEKAFLSDHPAKVTPLPDAPRAEGSPWARYPAGTAWLSRVGGAEPVHAVWLAPPGSGADGVAWWARAIAESAYAVIAAGRTVVIGTPDDATAEQVAAVCASYVGLERVVAFHSGASSAQRYRNWLQVKHSAGWCVVGTRSVAYLAAEDVGLMVCWDDASELHRARRAPYTHDRDAMRLMAERQGASTLTGGLSLSAAGWHQVQTGSAVLVDPTREAVRAWAPSVVIDDPIRAEARDGAAAYGVIPPVAVRGIAAAVADGTVVVQVGRRGYVPVVACLRCGTVVTCPGCGLAVELVADGSTECSSCGPRVATCGECGGTTWRAVATGLERVAEELRRALPAVPVDISCAGARVAVPCAPVTVCTPGCEPFASGAGHALAVGVMGGAGLGADADLNWVARALRLGSLVAPAARGGRMLLVGADATAQVRNAVAAWAPQWAAEHDWGHRTETGIPPAVWGAVVRADAATALWWESYVRNQCPAEVTVSSGPAVGASGHAVWVRCPFPHGKATAKVLLTGRALAPAASSVVVGPSPWW